MKHSRTDMSAEDADRIFIRDFFAFLQEVWGRYPLLALVAAEGHLGSNKLQICRTPRTPRKRSSSDTGVVMSTSRFSDDGNREDHIRESGSKNPEDLNPADIHSRQPGP